MNIWIFYEHRKCKYPLEFKFSHPLDKCQRMVLLDHIDFHFYVFKVPIDFRESWKIEWVSTIDCDRFVLKPKIQLRQLSIRAKPDHSAESIPAQG